MHNNNLLTSDLLILIYLLFIYLFFILLSAFNRYNWNMQLQNNKLINTNDDSYCTYIFVKKGCHFDLPALPFTCLMGLSYPEHTLCT